MAAGGGGDKTVTAKFVADVAGFEASMKSVVSSAKDAQEATSNLASGTKAAAGGLADAGTASAAAGKDADQAVAEFLGLGKAGETAGGSMKKVGEGGKEAGMGLNEMVSHISQSISDWQQLIAMAVQFVQAADKINQAAKDTQVAFTYLTGSAQKAQEAIKGLNNTWASAAFGTKAIDDVAQHFLMLGKDAQTTQKEIERVGDAMAAMGSDAKNMQPAIQSMHDIQDATIVTKEQINKLVDEGVPAWNALAEGMSAAKGKTIDVAEAQKEVNAGAVHGKEAYQDMMTGMMQYAGAAEEKSKGLSQAWEQFGEEAAPLLIPLIEELTKLLHAINEAIAGVEHLKQAMDSLGGGNNVLGSIGTGIMNSGLDPLGPLGGFARSGFVSPLQFFASGGSNLPAGWRVAGEDGPELQYSPGGDTIIPNGADPYSFLGGGARSALSSVGGMNGITIHLTTTTMLDSRVVAQQTIPHIAPIMRRQFGRRV